MKRKNGKLEKSVVDSPKVQVTFAQQFPNAHPAEVIASCFGKIVNDVMDDNALDCRLLSLEKKD